MITRNRSPFHASGQRPDLPSFTYVEQRPRRRRFRVRYIKVFTTQSPQR